MTYTITARPGEWLFVNAYDGFTVDPSSRERFGVVLSDTSLLPEEVVNEMHPNRTGRAYLTSLRPPAVDHLEGWEKLEAELRRMEACNRPRDDLFAGAVLEITFEMLSLPPRPHSRFTTPLVVFPVTLIKIVGCA